MIPGQNLALFLYAYHQSNVLLLKLLTSPGVGTEELQVKVTNFLLKIETLFQPTKEHDFSSFKEEVTYILVQMAKGKSEVDCFDEAYKQFEGLPDKEKQRELLGKVLESAVKLVNEFRSTLIEAGKIWWEHGYHKRQTIQLLGGCIHPEVKDTPDYITPTSQNIQKFLAVILNSSGEEESEYSEWLNLRVQYQSETKDGIENLFDQFASKLSLGKSKKRNFLLWLLNNGALLRYYQFSTTRIDIEKDYLKTLNKPGDHVDALKSFEDNIDKFLKMIALHPASRSSYRESSFALRVADYSQQWAALQEYKQVSDGLFFGHEPFRLLIQASLFDSKKVHEWILHLKKSNDPKEQAFCAALLPVVKIFNYEPVETVSDHYIEKPKKVHAVVDGKQDFPIQTFLTEGTNLDFRRALLADQNPNDRFSLPQFLFKNPRLTTLLFEHEETLRRAGDAWVVYVQKLEEKAKPQEVKKENQDDQAKQKSVEKKDEKQTVTIPPTQKNPLEEKIDTFLTKIKSPQIRKIKLIPVVNPANLNGEQKTLDEKNEQPKKSKTTTKHITPNFREQEITTVTFTYLMYLGAIAQEDFRLGDPFAIRLRYLIEAEGAQKEFRRAINGVNIKIAGINSPNPGLVDINSSTRFGDQKPFREFLLCHTTITIFLLENQEHFFKAAEIWNKTRSCQNVKPKVRKPPALPTIPEKKTLGSKAIFKSLFAKHASSVTDQPKSVAKPEIQEVEMNEDDMIIINVEPAIQCRA